jgi:hypothetical protein
MLRRARTVTVLLLLLPLFLCVHTMGEEARRLQREYDARFKAFLWLGAQCADPSFVAAIRDHHHNQLCDPRAPPSLYALALEDLRVRERLFQCTVVCALVATALVTLWLVERWCTRKEETKKKPFPLTPSSSSSIRQLMRLTRSRNAMMRLMEESE